MNLWGTKRPTIHTNAPRHWPAIEAAELAGPAGLLMIGADLASLHKPPTSSVAFLRDFLYVDGILRVPIVAEEGAQKTCVFVYTNRDNKPRSSRVRRSRSRAPSPCRRACGAE